MTTQRDNLQVQLNSSNQNNIGLTNQINQLNNQIVQLTNQRNQLTTERDNLNNQVINLNNQVNWSNNEINNLRNQLTQNSDNYDSQILKLSIQVSSLRDDGYRKDCEVGNLKSELFSLRNQLNEEGEWTNINVLSEASCFVQGDETYYDSSYGGRRYRNIFDACVENYFVNSELKQKFDYNYTSNMKVKRVGFNLRYRKIRVKYKEEKHKTSVGFPYPEHIQYIKEF